MSLKAELETWVSALAAYDTENFGEAIDHLFRIADSAKIFTNIGLIYATVGEHEAAVAQFEAAIQLDQYLAVAYFQCGVSNFVLGRLETALQNFQDASTYLRGNESINYEQLGLNFKLYSCEVQFNLGLSMIYLGQVEEGLQVLITSSQTKVAPEHNVIDEAIHNGGQGYTVFSMPVGVLYRPSEIKIKNVKQKDYMGKAKLVATADSNDVYTTFAGINRIKPNSTTDTEADVQPSTELSRSVTVQPPRVVKDLVPLQRSKTTQVMPLPLFRGLPSNDPREDSSREERGLASASNTSSDVKFPSASPTTTQDPSVPSALKPSNGFNVAAKPIVPLGRMRSTKDIHDYIDSYRNIQLSRVPPPELNNTNPSTREGVTNQTKDRPEPSNSRRHARSASAPTTQAPGMRRNPTKGKVANRTVPVVREEEEGYASGDHEDIPPSATLPKTKIRVKVHYQGDIRGLALAPDTPYEEFMNILSIKFGVSEDLLDVKFKDEDGGKVSLRDDMDYDLAMETAAVTAKDRTERRLEIWCIDI